MGNCKSSFGSSGSVSNSKDPKKTSNKKFMSSFSRAAGCAKRRSNRIAPGPDTSPAQANSSCSEFPSSHRLYEIFCRPSTSSSSNRDHFSSDSKADCCSLDPHPVENHPQEKLAVDYHSIESLESQGSDIEDTAGDEAELEIPTCTQEQIQSTGSITNCYEIQQKCTIDSLMPEVSEKHLKLRKMHIGQRMLNEIKELSTCHEKVQRLQEHQNDSHNHLHVLLSVKARTASASRKASKLTKSINKLYKAYRKHERKLCKARAERAVCVAKVDRYLTKLYPAIRYTDIYARWQSFYLSPIPEESELDLEEYELGIFPSETNTSLAAVALRQNQLFLDASPSSHNYHEH